MARQPVRELNDQDMKSLEILEGKILYVYDDAVWPTRMYRLGERVQGNLTAGVGHLLSKAEIQAWTGKTIPDDDIRKWLDGDTDIAENFINDNVKVALNDNQHAALVKWVFNVGVGAAGSSTLLRKLNKGDYNVVPTELARWNKTTINGKKVVSNGLVKRRAHEIEQWLAANDNTPVPAPRPEGMPTGTQVAEPNNGNLITPESVSMGTGVISVLGALTTGPIAWAFAIIAVGAFGIGAYFFVRNQLRK